MTRKAPPKKATAKKPTKPAMVYMAVRTMRAANESFTEPDRVFATKAAAQKYADQLNRELRILTNPFGEYLGPADLVSEGEDAFIALLKKVGVTIPKPQKGERYVDWEAWWDRSYFDITDAQREAIWDVLDEFEWYGVKQTTLED